MQNRNYVGSLKEVVMSTLSVNECCHESLWKLQTASGKDFFPSYNFSLGRTYSNMSINRFKMTSLKSKNKL